MKATWVRTDNGKGYNAGWLYRTYEYRGQYYTTYENLKRGNAMGEEVWRQHKEEQRRIDEKLDRPQTEPEWLTAEEEAKRKADWDAVWQALGMED